MTGDTTPRTATGVLGQKPHRCFPVVQNTTPPVHEPPPGSNSAALPICLTDNDFRGCIGLSLDSLDTLYPTGTVMVRTLFLHATSRTQAALGAAGRYNSVAPSNSHLK